MTHIEQMIKDMCPNGVEWKKLGDLGVFENTGVDKKSRDEEQEVTLLNFMDVCRHKYIDASVPTMIVTAPDRKIIQCNVLKDDIFITPSSETIDEIGFAAVIMEDLPNVVYSYHIMRYRLNKPDTTTAKFIRYLFEAPIIRKQILKGAKGLTRFGLSKYQFADIEIPIPPLEIQKKIVECLDKFSALAAELQAELQMRRKQYEYYRTQLLTPHSDCNSADKTDDRKLDSQGYTKGIAKVYDWEWKTLGEVCEMKAGTHINAADIKDSMDSEYIYPCFGGNGIRGYVKSNSHIGEYPIIGRQGALCGCVNYAQDKFYATEHAVVVKPNKGYSARYLFHMLTFADLNQYKSQGAQPGLAVGNLKTLRYAFPPLAEQKRIADLLDKFEALTTSLSEGIPAEQAAQQKRYEYYRDLLLTFDRKAV